MSTSDAAAVVERAIASYTAWAELDEATAAVDGDAANAEFDVFARDLERCLALDPQTALSLVTPFLSSANRFERAAAGRIVGRLGQANVGRLARSCSDVLFARLLGEADVEARDSIACGLGVIWNASGDETTPIELARHPNANVRVAAAQNLAMKPTDRPDHAAARAALQELVDDPDESVRGWAEVGLGTLATG
jgi:HEAT repeat protein